MISGEPGRERGAVETVARQAGLTRRQADILQLHAGEGLDLAEIARRLRISERTVQSHLSSARGRLLAEFSRHSDLESLRSEWS
jgi:RNA polymerase sigma factor (sigma-70 family)